MITRRHARVSGRVQGVGFRMSAVAAAGRLGVTGWVRNNADGTVEILVEGRPAAIRQFLAWCHDGPPAARVDSVDVTNGVATGEFREFRLRA